MVVSCFIGKQVLPYRDVKRGDSGVGLAEQWLAIDLAKDATAGFHDGVRPDDLQIEHEPSGLDAIDHVAQDVHDVLRLHSSE